ncbi:hypothetical protein BU17DRAFT_82208 [Hysterangium stoloniferum]|nr:hypothetical protein BU17DRAFT_82208 [Hysterangium stoloniferum]
MPNSFLDLPEEILEDCVGYVAQDNPHFYDVGGSPTDVFNTERGARVVFGPPRDILHFRLGTAPMVAYKPRRRVEERDVEVEILSFLPLATQAKNFHLLRVYLPNISESPDADADCNNIVNALLRQPLLQTVIIPDISRFELLSFAPTNILNLRINNYHPLLSLLPLTTLYLECLSVIDDVVLSDLVDAFPKLQRLSIFSEGHNTQ